MTKTQKILLWVGLALFIIPEILWSPTGNLVYAFSQNSNSPSLLRETAIMNSGNVNYLNFVLSVQFVGVFLSFLMWSLKIRKEKLSTSWLLVSFLLFVWAVFQFLLAGISINVRSIGF